MNIISYKGFLEEVGETLKERAIEAKKDYDLHEDKTLYQAGRLQAYYEIISILQSRAEFFEINLKEMKLDNFDPDKELKQEDNK